MAERLGDKAAVGREEIQERLAQFVQHWEKLQELAKARWVGERRPNALSALQALGWCWRVGGCGILKGLLSISPQLPISIYLLSPCSNAKYSMKLSPIYPRQKRWLPLCYKYTSTPVLACSCLLSLLPYICYLSYQVICQVSICISPQFTIVCNTQWWKH